MPAEFVHLHVHSQYSFLDGAVRIGQLADRTKELGMKAVAITDHASMFGALQFYKACKERDIQPIVGCEVNVARPEEGREGRRTIADHFVLLAETEEGYKNLIRIVSMGQIESASDTTPSVAWATIAEHSRGLIGLTGCMGGVLAQKVLEHGKDAGLAMLDRMKSAFAPDSLFVELQDHDLVEQPVLNKILTEIAAGLSVPLVATNDVHYLAKDDADAQLYLSCAHSGRSYAEAKALHHNSAEMYFKSAEEMGRRFRDAPEAVRATLRIAERCHGVKLKLGRPMLPDFKVPEGFDTAGYFAYVAREGLRRRLQELAVQGKTIDRENYEKRLETEIQVIAQMDFTGYFLIVWDFIRHAKNRGIPVGPGRGSGAGSLVAYAMRITDLDPIPYGLLFERFLNPERVSMPDFDIDFCMVRRDEVIAYVSEKYGRESVGQIATFHELKARSVIKDVARAMGMPANEAQVLASMIPQNPRIQGQMYTIPEALEVEPKLAARVKDDPVARDLIGIAKKLEGLTRHPGKHAAGVVISRGPLWDHVPCFLNEEKIVTQYDKDDVEVAGLVKFDFLGLKTLTVLDVAVRLVDARPDRGGQKFDLGQLPLDDKPTYQLLQTGETTGVFQLDSTGMQQLFKDYRPDTFEDIVALGALYRPGPLGSGMVKDFIDTKHKRKPVQSLHPLCDHVVAPTRGAIVYQEQVMQIAQTLSGYTLGSADLLRRAMGKKKPEEMAKQRAAFVDGAVNNGVRQEEAERIFSLLEYFAGYGFNKSHSAAYGLLTYQTAYLKAHYPVEFLCALLTSEQGKIEKIVRIIAEGRALDATILPPDINMSQTDFTVVYASPEGNFKPPRGSKIKDPYQPQIRFGLGAVRGLGESALAATFEARAAGGPFHDLFDFAGRVDSRKVNKATLESLIQCGAFDAVLAPRGINRARAQAAVDRALERSRSASKDRERGQTTLFALLETRAGSGSASRTLDEYPPSDPWDSRDTLMREKQALGFYVSGHPLERYGSELGRFEVTRTIDLSGRQQWDRVRVAGVVENYRERIFKSGSGRAAFFDLEDEVGKVDVKVAEKRIEAFAAVLGSGEPVLVEGKVSFPMTGDDEPDETEGRRATLLADSVQTLADAIKAEARAVAIRLSADRMKPDQLRILREVLERSPGNCHVSVVIELSDGAQAVLSLGSSLKVAPSDAMLAGLERLFGDNVAELR